MIIQKKFPTFFYAENANADYAYPAEDPEYFFLKYTYADLYSKLKNCLDNIIQLQKDLKNEKSKNKKNELQKQYKILENISRQLHELSIKQTDSILADSDEKFLEELLEKCTVKPPPKDKWVNPWISSVPSKTTKPNFFKIA